MSRYFNPSLSPANSARRIATSGIVSNAPPVWPETPLAAPVEVNRMRTSRRSAMLNCRGRQRPAPTCLPDDGGLTSRSSFCLGESLGFDGSREKRRNSSTKGMGNDGSAIPGICERRTCSALRSVRLCSRRPGGEGRSTFQACVHRLFSSLRLGLAGGVSCAEGRERALRALMTLARARCLAGARGCHLDRTGTEPLHLRHGR